jgi:hypothetical protein
LIRIIEEKKYQEFIFQASEHLKVHPNDKGILLIRSQEYKKLGDFKNSIKDASKVIKIDSYPKGYLINM